MVCLRQQKLRRNGINASFYPDATKIKKQLQYANKKQIPFVTLLGKDELKNNQILVKNMATGTQKNCSNETDLQHFLSL